MNALEELGITRDDVKALSGTIDQVNKNHREILSFSEFILSGAEQLLREHADVVKNIVALGN